MQRFELYILHQVLHLLAKEFTRKRGGREEEKYGKKTCRPKWRAVDSEMELSGVGEQSLPWGGPWNPHQWEGVKEGDGAEGKFRLRFSPRRPQPTPRRSPGALIHPSAFS